MSPEGGKWPLFLVQLRLFHSTQAGTLATPPYPYTQPEPLGVRWVLTSV